MDQENNQNLSQGRIKRFVRESAKNGLLVFVSILIFSVSWMAIATFTQNDNQGFFLVDFNGNQDGIVSSSQGDLRQNISVNVVTGLAEITDGFFSGFFTTTEIKPSSFSSWNKIEIESPLIGPLQTVVGSLYTCEEIPAPIPGWNNLNFLNGSPSIFDISALSPSSYPCIRLRIDLTNSTGNPSSALDPYVDWLKVSWDPKSLFLVNVNGPTSVQSGGVYSTNISYSNSFVDSLGTVVWMQLPTYLNGSITNYTTAYNQNPQTSFSSATSGGIYTAGGTIVNGVTIPAKSVYWDLGVVPAGRSGTLVVRISTGSGWQNAMILNHTANMESSSGQAVVSDSNSLLVGNQPAETIIVSAPSPGITKTVSGVAKINGVNYVVDAPPLTPIVTYSISLQNTSGSIGTETIFNPTITDDVSDILNKLSSVCGVPNVFNSRFTVNNGGSFSPTDETITWSQSLGSFGHIAPGASAVVTYTVDYSDCPSAVFGNNVVGKGDNIANVSDSESVTVGIDTTPTGIFAKGDKVNNNSSIISNVDDNKFNIQTYGEIFSYLLHGQNGGATAIGGIVMADKISSDLNFVSATLPANITGGQVYYNTGGAANNPDSPPTYTVGPTGISGTGWSAVLAVDPSEVRWVAFYIPCLNSTYFPFGVGNTDCQNQPASVTATINVQIRQVPNVCFEKDTDNTGVFQIYRASENISNQALTNLVSKIQVLDLEETHIGPSLGILSGNSSVSGSNYMQVGTNEIYTFNISNTGNDTAQNTILTIALPKVKVNGVDKYLDFVSATGGSGINTIIDPLFNQIGTVVINLQSIAPNSSKTATLTLSLPNGALNNSTFSVIGVLNATDDNFCKTITATVSKQVTVESDPNLQVFKTVDEKIIPGGEVIHYDISFRNTGSSPSTNTYVLEKIPAKTVFDSAYTTGTDTSGTTFDCVGCTVLFSNNAVDLPGSLSTTNPLNVQIINGFFTPGIQTSPGVWSPNGYPKEEVLWVAWKVDDNAFSPAILLASLNFKTVGLKIRNDDNGPLPSLVPSPIGTLISNAPGILADDLPQAIDAQVFTTILPDPGLRIDKYSSKDYLRSGETFSWTVEYFNDSGNDDTFVNLTDTLPTGVTIDDIFHEWNNVAISNGMPSGEVSVYPSNVSINNNQIIFSPTTYKAGDLEKLEGGKLRFLVTVQNTAQSGSILNNDVSGYFENPSGFFTVFDSDEVFVENPDLWMSSKQPDYFNPVAGDTLNYTIVFSNQGFYDAPNVTITDTLEQGLCYDGPTVVVTPLWTLPEPVVSGDCNTGPTTLTWDNVISRPGYPAGTIPGMSGNIIVRYNISVVNTVLPGTDLQNGACLATNIVEDPIYNNCTGISVTTPYPDPYVTKEVQLVVLPGDSLNYTITYGNLTKQSANNSYIIDSLPDYTGDGKADMKIISVSGSNGEQFYYHDASLIGITPTFDPSNPLSAGWQLNSSNDTNFIAILTGPLPSFAGPLSVTVTLQAVDPTTSVNLPTGITLTNTVQIYLPAGILDQDISNNIDTATTVIPGIDLWVQKTGSAEGGFPGVGPGDQITYTVEFGNQGTEPACGVYIDDLISSGLSKDSPFHNAGNLYLTNIAGNQVFPVDTSGNTIFTPVNINFDSNDRFEIGNNNTCLPPGSYGEFEIYVKVDEDLSDGEIVNNTAIIGEESSDVEDILWNNTDTSQTVVYRSDLTIEKTGISKGPDGILGTGDDNTTNTAIGENIQYTLEYKNIGSSPAQNSIITETVPSGMCYIDGSIDGYPADATIEFSNNNGANYNYTPIGPVDCSVTHFRVVFGSPIYPGSNVGEDLNIGSLGNKTNIIQADNANDYYLKLASTLNPFLFPNVSVDFSIVEDLNKDNFLDTVFSGFWSTNMFSWYRGIYENSATQGTVSFDLANGVSIMPKNLINFNADLNNDTYTDLARFNANNIQAVLMRNTSNISQIQFSEYFLPSYGGAISSLQSEDFNNDGKKDIAVFSQAQGGSVVFKNNSIAGGVFDFDTISPSILNTTCTSAFQKTDYIVDLNNDGKKDIVFSCDYLVSYFENITDTSSSSNPILFDNEVVLYSGLPYGRVNLYDFNDDGQMDILVRVDNGENYIFQNNSSGSSISFSSLQLDSNVSLLYNFLVEDFDDDNFPDIVFMDYGSNQIINILRNNTSSVGGNISFEPSEIIADTGSSIKEIQVKDFNNDNKKDLILLKTDTNTENYISVYKNETIVNSGSIDFDSSIDSPSIGTTPSMNGFVLEDLDGNSLLDVVVYPELTVVENKSSINLIKFGNVTDLNNNSSNIKKPKFYDFDNDNKKDLLSGDFGYDSSVVSSIYKNYSTPGNISFGPIASNGSYVVPINITTGLWQRLMVKHDKPVGTEIEYTIYDNTCGGTALIPTTTIPDQFIDISSLGGANSLCLVIDFSTSSAISTPVLDGWQMTYAGGPGAKITYDLQVSTTNTSQSITNTATIQTDSDEINYDNNTDDYEFYLTQADVEIIKSVNFASADPGDTLTYVLNYRNNGPLDAHNVLIDDILPAGVSPISWTQISGTDTVTCVINYSANSISCTDTSTPDWVLSPNESGSIEIEVTIAGNGVPISFMHTDQSDFDINDGTANISTSTVPGSLVPVNAIVEMDINATSIDYIDLYLYDDSWNLIEGTSGNVSDLINFTVTSLSPVTLQYVGPLPINVNNLYINMSLSGGNVSSYNMSAYDMSGDTIADYVYGGTELGSFSSSITDPIDLSLPFVLQTVYPGYSAVSNPGTTVTTPQAQYINHFDMPGTACPTGSRKWGTLSVDVNDPQGNVSVFLSDNPSYPMFLANSAPTVDQVFTMYGYTAPTTLYYHVVVDRFDTSYFPEVNEISVETTCDGGVAPGTQLINTTTISTSTRDTDMLNNTDTALTVIGEISNLRVDKTGPTQVSIGNSFTYTIDVENNGNVPAENVTLIDILPSQVGYVSASSSGAISFSCINNLGTLSCTGSGSLDSGDIATLTVTVSVPNSITLIGDVLHNVVTVATTTSEVTVVDNIDDYDITIAPLGNSSISGYVYIDTNTNNQKESGEPGIENISVLIAGKDLFGNVYGPDKNIEPLIYQEAMDKLVAISLIPNRPYLATDPYPARYFPINADVTTASGAWMFDNYNPGTYAVFERHPVLYTSTGSNAGYGSVDVLGNPIFDIIRDGIGSFESGLSIDEDLIYTIMLSENQNAVQYNFGEINGEIGDLVFEDKNSDGTFNGADVGIAGVQVNLYGDLNNNGSVDVGETSQTTTTNASGNYMFSGLTIGAQYIVEVVDSVGTLATYNAIIGPNPGANNNSQNPNGYIVMLALGNSINLTADFGYHSPNTDCCSGGGGGGDPTPTGFVGNQVFYDENANGIFDGSDIGIPDVKIVLWLIRSGLGSGRPSVHLGDQEIGSMLTNQYGVYGWANLDVNGTYLVEVLDTAGVLREFTHISGPNQTLDNHSKPEMGYRVMLSPLNPINNTADFGYIGYELPRTGQAALGRILFGVILVGVTMLALWIFKGNNPLTGLIISFKIKNNGKS